MTLVEQYKQTKESLFKQAEQLTFEIMKNCKFTADTNLDAPITDFSFCIEENSYLRLDMTLGIHHKFIPGYPKALKGIIILSSEMSFYYFIEHIKNSNEFYLFADQLAFDEFYNFSIDTHKWTDILNLPEDIYEVYSFNYNSNTLTILSDILCIATTKNLDLVNSFYSLDLKQPMTKDDALEYIMDKNNFFNLIQSDLDLLVDNNCIDQDLIDKLIDSIYGEMNIKLQLPDNIKVDQIRIKIQNNPFTKGE